MRERELRVQAFEIAAAAARNAGRRDATGATIPARREKSAPSRAFNKATILRKMRRDGVAIALFGDLAV
jgi:hypothetical protein